MAAALSITWTSCPILTVSSIAVSTLIHLFEPLIVKVSCVLSALWIFATSEIASVTTSALLAPVICLKPYGNVIVWTWLAIACPALSNSIS